MRYSSRRHAEAESTATLYLPRSAGSGGFEIRDHDTVTQLDFFNAQDPRDPDFLLGPGIEVTTYAEHANAIRATSFVDPKVGLAGVTVESVTDAAVGRARRSTAHDHEPYLASTPAQAGAGDPRPAKKAVA